MFTEQGQRVNSNAGANYAPKKFSDHPTNEGFTKAIFGSAMQSLLAKNKIKIVKGGSPVSPDNMVGDRMIASTPLHLPNLAPSTLLQLWVHLCIQLHFIYYCHIPLKPQLDFSDILREIG